MYLKLIKSFSTLQKPVSIKYSELISEKVSLFPLIEKAYGLDGLGIIVVEDVPEFEQKRKNALSLIHKLAHLPAKTLEKYENPSTNYSKGWSRGKEIYENEPDFLKGSFYSTLPIYDKNAKTGEDKNIWPDDNLPDLKPALLETGSQMRSVGLELLSVIDKYIHSKFNSHNLNSQESR